MENTGIKCQKMLFEKIFCKKVNFFEKKCLTKRGGDVIIESEESGTTLSFAAFPTLEISVTILCKDCMGGSKI